MTWDVSRPMIPTLSGGSAAIVETESDMAAPRAIMNQRDFIVNSVCGHNPLHSYGVSSLSKLIANSAIFSPPPDATRLLTISYEPSANAFFVGTYAGASFDSSITSVVLNGDACLIARPSSTNTSPGSVTIAMSGLSRIATTSMGTLPLA